jgi:hypothetical protein
MRPARLEVSSSFLGSLSTLRFRLNLIECLGFRVSTLRCRLNLIESVGFRVSTLRFRSNLVESSGFNVQGLGFYSQDSTRGLGFKVQG